MHSGLFGQTTNNILPLNSHAPLASQLSPFTPAEATHVRRTAASNLQSQVPVSQTLRPQTSFPTSSSSFGLLRNRVSENSIGEKHVYLYYNTHISGYVMVFVTPMCCLQDSWQC